MTVRVKTPAPPAAAAQQRRPQRPMRYRRDSFEEARWAAAQQQKNATPKKTSLIARICACFRWTKNEDGAAPHLTKLVQ